MTGSSPAPVVVSIPGDAAYLHILRAVTGAVAARLRMPVDSIEDLRLAVHEAASYLISATDGAALTLELRATAQDLRAVVTAEAVVGVWPPEGFEGSLARTVMAGLADSSMVRLQGNAPAIELRKRTLDP
ncbi:MAG TPA: anti-sigma factor [Actinomycetota bacterium]